MFKILIDLQFLFGVFFGGLEFSLTLVIGDEDACGAPKLLLRDVSTKSHDGHVALARGQ
jgi:hypothetical protein